MEFANYPLAFHIQIVKDLPCFLYFFTGHLLMKTLRIHVCLINVAIRLQCNCKPVLCLSFESRCMHVECMWERVGQNPEPLVTHRSSELRN